MKHLTKILKESIFDDDIDVKAEEAMSQTFFTDPNSPLYDIVSDSVAYGGILNPYKQYSKGGRFENNAMYLPGKVTFMMDNLYKMGDLKIICAKYRQEDIDIVGADNLSLRCMRSQDINGDNFAKTIEGASIYIINPKSLKDITFNIKDDFIKGGLPKFSIVFDWKKPEIENIKVNFLGTPKPCIINSEVFLPMTGISTNANNIIYHDTFCLIHKSWEELFNKYILDTSYEAEVYDTLKKEYILRKMSNLKKVIATVNNPKRYQPKTPIIKVKDGVNIGKLFGLKNCKSVHLIQIYNNNVIIYIRKGHNGLNPMTYSDDGWQISIEKNYM